MRIWRVTIGEPWPNDTRKIRLLRTGVIASQYSSRGDDVVWFNESFDHFTRHQKAKQRHRGLKAGRLEIVALDGRGYRGAVSVTRMLHHVEVARDFRDRIGNFERPDVIVASLTPLELCREAVRYGKKNGIPVIVDVRDLWPEIWLQVLPRMARPLARMAFSPYFSMLKEIVDNSAALCGVSEEAVEWALGRGSRRRNPFDGALPLAYRPPDLSAPELAEAENFWSSQGIERDDGKLTICFFGNISHRVELETVIQAVESAPTVVLERVRLVFCGHGEADGKLRELARKFNMVRLPGWMNAAQIEVLKRRSNAGLLPYPSDLDFTRSIPNKFFDYLSGGLPVLTSLKGVTAQIIERESCGWIYENRDSEDFLKVVQMLLADRGALTRAAANARSAGAQFAAEKIYGEFRNRLDAIVAA